jgi:hypothetical protein
MVRAVYLTAFFGLAVFYYYLLGAGPTPSEVLNLEWWRPRGWALRWESLQGLAALAEEPGALRLVPVILYSIPPAIGMIFGVRLFRSAVARVLLLALGTTLVAFAFYGHLAEGIWRFFSWRWAAVTLCMSLLVWGLILAPSLIRATLRLPMAGRIAALLVAVAAVYLPSVEITGTGWPGLRLTPWPVIPVFGFLLIGYLIAALHAAVGLGALLRSSFAGPTSIAAGILLAAVLASLFSLGLFSEPTLRGGIVLGLLGAAGAAVVLFSATGRPEAAARGRYALAAGVLGLSLIFLSDRASIRDQMVNRDETAPIVLDALDRYYEANEAYPDRLEELAPDLIASVPNPRIGLIRHEGEEFIYTNLGDSYVLEFACAKWVQCAYSPGFGAGGWGGGDPNSADPNMGGATGPDVAGGPAEGRELEGAWTCDSRPPPLW